MVTYFRDGKLKLVQLVDNVGIKPTPPTDSKRGKLNEVRAVRLADIPDSTNNSLGIDKVVIALILEVLSVPKIVTNSGADIDVTSGLLELANEDLVIFSFGNEMLVNAGRLIKSTVLPQ
jgi:hypothetical protein